MIPWSFFEKASMSPWLTIDYEHFFFLPSVAPLLADWCDFANCPRSVPLWDSLSQQTSSVTCFLAFSDSLFPWHHTLAPFCTSLGIDMAANWRRSVQAQPAFGLVTSSRDRGVKTEWCTKGTKWNTAWGLGCCSAVAESLSVVWAWKHSSTRVSCRGHLSSALGRQMSWARQDTNVCECVPTLTLQPWLVVQV